MSLKGGLSNAYTYQNFQLQIGWQPIEDQVKKSILYRKMQCQEQRGTILYALHS